MQTKLFSAGRLVLALIALPLALGLTACGKKDGDAAGANPVGAPLNAVAPPAGKAWTDARKNMEAGKPLYPLSR